MKRRTIIIEQEKDVDYTMPVIKHQPNRSFIEFYKNSKRYRMTCDTNRIKDINKRTKILEEYKVQIEKNLKNGWDPATVPDEEEDALLMTFGKALDKGFERACKDLRKTSKTAYTCFFNYVKGDSYFEEIKNDHISEIKRKEINILLDNIEATKKLSFNMRNRVLTVLKIIFNILIEMEIIEYNPVEKIKFKKTEKPRIKLPTPMEINNIKNYLCKYAPGIWEFAFFIFQSGLRPNEILSITLDMIDMDRRIIIVPKEYVKTKVDRYVSIDEPLFHFLKSKHLNKYSKSSYLFGKVKPGPQYKKQFQDLGVSKDTASRVSITNLWNRLVKEDLEIDVNLYSFKHLRANYELTINNSLEQAKILFGHTNMNTTEIYANQKDLYYTEKLKTNTLNLNNLPINNTKTN